MKDKFKFLMNKIHVNDNKENVYHRGFDFEVSIKII